MTDHALVIRGSSLVRACDSSRPFILGADASQVVSQFCLIAILRHRLPQSEQLVLEALGFDYVVCQF